MRREEAPERPRYRAVQEETGSWSVLDTVRGCGAVVANEPMVLLEEQYAKMLAYFLNLEDQMGTRLTLQ